MKYTLIAIVCLIYSLSYGQYEAANWYFGEYAGIHFDSNTGKVSALTNGKLTTKEGASSISDKDGNLLFYTDGSTVFTRQHTVMQNGTGLYGDVSSTQSALVVPAPNSTDIFYVFTVDTQIHQNDPNYGFNYSVIDLSLEKGLGAVTTKNQNLLSHSSEKVSAVVKDCQTKSIWVITLSTATGINNNTALNTFYAYEISDTGLNTTPVTSTINANIYDSRGALKFSPDGTKLVCANMSSGLFLFDFDADTGMVSNQKSLSIKDYSSNRPYGVAFSPNNRFLYIHASNDNNGNNAHLASSHNSVLVQYDLEAEDISNSQIILDNQNLYRGALQLGPDGKIYRALSATYDQGLPYLGVIENPNAKGTAANYKHKAIDLQGKRSTQGLPPFIQSFFNQKIDIIHASDGVPTNQLSICEGETYTLKSDSIPNATYSWTLNGAPLSNASTPWTMTVSTPGLYKVLISPQSGTICDNLEGEAHVSLSKIPVANAPSDLTNICDANNDSTEIINLTLQNAQILNTQNSNQFRIKYFTSELNALSNIEAIASPEAFQTESAIQSIYARIENIDNPNCFDLTDFNISLIPSPKLSTQDIYSCDVSVPFNDGLSIFNLNKGIVSSEGDLSFYIEDPKNNPSAIPITNPSQFENSTQAQRIYVRAINNKTGCYSDDSFILNAVDASNQTETVYFCTNSEITLNIAHSSAPTTGYSYSWFKNGIEISNATQYYFTTDTIGQYQIAIRDNTSNCVELKTFIVEESGPALLDNIAVNDVSATNTISCTVSGKGSYEYALYHGERDAIDKSIYRDFQSSSVFTHLNPGIYTLAVKDIKNNCGTVEQTVYVVGFTKYFSPNADGYNDTFKIEGASETFMANSKVYIFDRFGKLIKEMTANDVNWDGTFKGIPLPQDDYWFSATLTDGRNYTSHFTLKR